MRTISAGRTEHLHIPVNGESGATGTTGADPDPGSAVAATVWHPQGPARAVVVVHPATATPQTFYRAFAEFLADRGLVTLTYDYRGTGRSGAPREHRRVRMRDWMEQDVPAVAGWVRRTFPELPTFAVGHSVGGHALALGCGIEGVTALTLVSSHAGVTAQIPDRGERLRVRAFFAVAPTLSRLLGHAPARLAGFGEDLPRDVVREWAPWTRRPGYFFDDPTMDAARRAGLVHQRVLAVGASDDPWATPAQIEAITDHLTGCRVERRTVAPQDLGVQRVGHHGLLRRGVGEPFWADLVRWWEGQLPPGRSERASG